MPADPTTRGIVAPPDDKFDSFGETVNAVRAAAALFGADAKDSQMGGRCCYASRNPSDVVGETESHEL